MQKIKRILLIISILAGLVLVTLPTTTSAYNVFDNCPQGSTSTLCNNNPNDLMDYIQIIVNTLLFVIGTLSVITIIIAGIRYTLSRGEPGAVKVAKDTLFYAVIGLVVAIMSYAIVNFVVGRFNF